MVRKDKLEKLDLDAPSSEDRFGVCENHKIAKSRGHARQCHCRPLKCITYSQGYRNEMHVASLYAYVNRCISSGRRKSISSRRRKSIGDIID